MEPKLYKVDLTQHASYFADIVATTPDEACNIARQQLTNMLPPQGFTREKHDTTATAIPAPVQPSTVHSVVTWYKLECAQMVPANSEAEAKEHFRRLIACNGPFNYHTGEDAMSTMVVEQSSPNGGPRNA